MITVETKQDGRNQSMLPTMDTGGPAVSEPAIHVLVVEDDPAAESALTSALAELGYHTSCASAIADAVGVVRASRPDLIILGDHGNSRAGELCRSARERDIPIMGISDAIPRPTLQSDWRTLVDEWVVRSNAGEECAARAAWLLNRRSRTANASTLFQRLVSTPQFYALVVHDLRNPLNVIKLSLRMLDQVLPKGNSNAEEDFRFVEENVQQIEQMLAQLSDYLRLFEGEVSLNVSLFNPQTVVRQLVEGQAFRHRSKSAAVRVDVQRTCPREVSLDEKRAVLALQLAISNAVTAAGNGGVVVTLRGEPQRWLIEIATESPPVESVLPTELRSHVFERLNGSASERRGLDLAIAARVTEMFGGKARLDVVPKRGTTIVLDWPEQITESPH